MIISCSLNPESLQSAATQLRDYAKTLNDKCDQLSEKLCEEGIEFAKSALAQHGVTDGKTVGGIQAEKGDNGTCSLVSSGKHVAYLEFGTGVVGAGTYPTTLPIEWEYDTRQSPWAHDSTDPTLWYYYNEAGRLRRTRGNEAYAYMAQASEGMRQRVHGLAKEVFQS
jgi:hypothetical protein